jgi:2,3-dimethylmalate lyase
VFIEAPQSTDEMQQICSRVPFPLLINVVEGGRTPQLSFEQYADLGYKIVLYPTAAIRVVMRSLQTLYGRLCSEGDTATVLDSLVGFKERNEITDLRFFEDLEDLYQTDGSSGKLNQGELD